MVAVTLPSEDDTDEAMEKWYVDQIYELTKQKEQHKVLPKALIQDAPSPIKERESEFLQQQSGQGNDARLKFQLTGTPASDPTNRPPPLDGQPVPNSSVDRHVWFEPCTPRKSCPRANSGFV